MLFCAYESKMSEKIKILKGFSKKSPEEKLLLAAGLCADPDAAALELTSFQHQNKDIQQILSGISENTISNYPLPYNIAPNFLINGQLYMVPMVIEESSVVAAASSAARFWAGNGGFRAKTDKPVKKGQLHFLYASDGNKLKGAMPSIVSHLKQSTRTLTQNMEKRGGGVVSVELNDRQNLMDNYFQLDVRFDTRDAMGANFINSVLEEYAVALESFFNQTEGFDERDFEPLMAILTNYNDECLVEVSVSCDVDALGNASGTVSADDFLRRFVMAVNIAESDVYRAATHNKGIMNGVDAVVLATGNDFRAIEAGAHAWAARSGQYRSLSKVTVTGKQFTFSLEMPMALGTTGGLTNLHPLAARSLEILGNPDARTLMMIAGAAGLANNFAALRSLVTTGIQTGHMRMHLSNILLQLKASPGETANVESHFANKKVSYQAVASYLEKLRKHAT